MRKLSDCIPPQCLEFVKTSGADLTKRIGLDEMRSIVAGILCGENVRSATEPLTRRRISVLNAGVLITIARASQFLKPEELLDIAYSEIQETSESDPKHSVLMWILGLTKKQVQNVLRSDKRAWDEFITNTKKVTGNLARYSKEQFGEIHWTIEIDDLTTEWNWLWAHSLMISLGTQALAIRGAEKSMYGKFFEKMVLGSVLKVLGFRLDSKRSGSKMTFWMSERGEKRESDATAIIEEGRGIRFDIGFIGPGNTEISLDKVSRFSRFDEISGRKYDMSTIIIVDRIGGRSRIKDLAGEIDGTILQMSSSLWPKDLDEVLNQQFKTYKRKFKHSAQAKDIRSSVFSTLTNEDIETFSGEADKTGNSEKE